MRLEPMIPGGALDFKKSKQRMSVFTVYFNFAE